MTQAISRDDMRSQLRYLDHAREILASTEPLATYEFTVGNAVRFHVQPGWQHGVEAKDGSEPVNATITLGVGAGSIERQLTKDALLEATSACGLSKGYAARCPADLLEPQLNFWFREGLGYRRGATRDFQLLVAGDYGAAITRSSIVPYSNLRLLEQAIDGIEAKYGNDDILVDYKFAHSLRRTHLRLIVPAYTRELVGTGTDDDTWSVGIQIRNSLIGAERTEFSAYLFRWICTNGQTDTRATQHWRRPATGRGAVTEVYDWARQAVDEVLAGLEPALDAVQLLADIPVESASDTLRDVFEHYRVPLNERARIIDNMANTPGEPTMYTIMAAITQAANDTRMDPTQVENLLRMGGNLPHAANSRCDECRRIMPEN